MKIRIINNALWSPTFKLWGDYWVIRHLQDAFQKLGHTTHNIVEKDVADFNLYLCGGPYTATHKCPSKMDIAWFYSRIKEDVIQGLNTYKAVFCIGNDYSNKLKTKIKPPVFPMIGCTHVIPPTDIPKKDMDIVMVANSRLSKNNIHKSYGRKIIDDLDPINNKFKLNIWGYQWERSPKGKQFLKGQFTDNYELGKLYGRSKIVLNDSHDEMVKNGFITIRTYDIVASGALCISAPTAGLKDVFEDTVVTYDSPQDLVEKTKFYLANDDERNRKIKRGIELIRDKELTYDKNARFILHVLGNHI